MEHQNHTEGAIPWRITFEDRGLSEDLPLDFDSWRGDGILSRSITMSMYERLQEKNVPIVELLGDRIHLFPEVCVDESISARMAVDHFRSRGIRHFGFYAYGNTWWTTSRRDAFTEYTKSLNLDCYVCPDCLGDSSIINFYPRWEERYRKSLTEWLILLPKPIGIWAASDIQAIRIMQVCQELNIKSPEQIAVLGTANDSLLCNLQYPPMSSLDINGEAIGFEAAKLLEEKIQKYQQTDELPPPPLGISNFQPINVQPIGVVVRQSTDMVAIDNIYCSKALKFIQEEYFKDISAEAVAEHVNISRSTLDRLFRKLLGRSVEKEIYRLRMELAEKLLRETDLSVNAVAKRTGFDRVEYFVRTFKKIFGDPPQKYRNRCKVR